MENSNERRSVTRAYLESLPVVTIQVGSKPRQCRLDKSTGEVFLLDDSGEFTGSVSKIPAQQLKPSSSEIPAAQKMDLSAAEQTEQPVSAVIERTEAQAENEAPEDNQKEHNEKGTEAPKEKFPWIPFFIGLFVTMLIIAIVIRSIEGENAHQETQPQLQSTQTVTTAPEETEPAETTIPTTSPAEETEQTAPAVCYALVASRTLLPGDVLKAGDLSMLELPVAEYLRVCANGGVYTEAEQGLLIGMEVAAFIPSGQYITYDAVTPEFAPVNPWGRTDIRQMTVRLPIMVEPDQIMDYIIGNCADLTVVIQTKVTTPAEGEDSEEDGEEEQTPEGTRHHTSIVESMVIDTYTIQAAVVVDLLNEKGNSLYDSYAALATIPSVFRTGIMEEQFATEDKLAVLIPVYIEVAVTTEQGMLLQSLDTENMTVTLSNGTPSVTNEIQREAYLQLQDLMQTLKTLWADVRKDA